MLSTSANPQLLSPTGLNMVPNIWPDKTTYYPSAALVDAYLRAGVHGIRITLASETFFDRPDFYWAPTESWIRMARARAGALGKPLAIELVLASVDPDPATSPHKKLVQGWEGRIGYAEGAMELVKRGVKAFGDKVSYQLTTEPALDNPRDWNDPSSAMMCDELNALLFAGVRSISDTAWLVLSSPAWEHVETMFKMRFGGDRRCRVAGHLYDPNGTGKPEEIDIKPGQDILTPMRAHMAIARAAADRLGRELQISEWGGGNLGADSSSPVRNDWATSTVYLAQKKVLTENGLWNRAFYWMDKTLFRLDGSQIQLASTTPATV